MERIRNPGRRALRAQLEARHVQKVTPRAAPARIEPAVYDPLGGQAMRVDRSPAEKVELATRAAR